MVESAFVVNHKGRRQNGAIPGYPQAGRSRILLKWQRAVSYFRAEGDRANYDSIPYYWQCLDCCVGSRMNRERRSEYFNEYLQDSTLTIVLAGTEMKVQKTTSIGRSIRACMTGPVKKSVVLVINLPTIVIGGPRLLEHGVAGRNPGIGTFNPKAPTRADLRAKGGRSQPWLRHVLQIPVQGRIN